MSALRAAVDRIEVSAVAARHRARVVSEVDGGALALVGRTWRASGVTPMEYGPNMKRKQTRPLLKASANARGVSMSSIIEAALAAAPDRVTDGKPLAVLPEIN